MREDVLIIITMDASTNVCLHVLSVQACNTVLSLNSGQTRSAVFKALIHIFFFIQKWSLYI